VSSVDFEKVSGLVDVPENAAKLLSRAERQQILTLTLRTGHDEVLFADAYVVYYNTSRGPAKGGIRISPAVTLEETIDLAERMVWKTALVKIPFGGGKSGICVDAEKLDMFVRTGLMHEFVHLIYADLEDGAYIPAPDLGSRPSDMAAIYGQTHMTTSVTGKPPRVGGLPGRKEATGRGVAYSARRAIEDVLKQDITKTTVAVQGFGNVGSWAAQFLSDWGARVVAVSDAQAGYHNPKGLDIDALRASADRTGLIQESGNAETISNDELLGLEADVLVPAAVENVLTAETAPKVKARLVVEGANGPTTPEADEILESAGVVAVPDILANAGGVIASYIEWRNAKSGSITDREEVFESLETVIGRAYDEVMALAGSRKVSLRLAAQAVAVEEVVGAMQDRGWV